MQIITWAIRWRNNYFSKKIWVGGTINNATVIRLEPPAIISYEQIENVLTCIEEGIAGLR
ncbi:hypothetical protein [Paenibacillus phytorum]|uniref:hypothetical protein n=1 Tax=Paenibacillus phytorum TaxID=2654977 RepID=UPI001FEA39E1|nr:hypothetical protein [Paenibacillus phytorum]